MPFASINSAPFPSSSGTGIEPVLSIFSSFIATNPFSIVPPETVFTIAFFMISINASRLFLESFHGKRYSLSLQINRNDSYLNLVTDRHNIHCLLDKLVAKLRYVDKSVILEPDIHKSPKISNIPYRSWKNHIHLEILYL